MKTKASSLKRPVILIHFLARMILNKDTVDFIFIGERLIASSKRRNRTKMFLLMTPIQHDKGRASQCKRKENTMHID